MSELNSAALEALTKGQKQADEDGVMVTVSRQALDELLEAWNTRASEWVSCAERLPENGELVLAQAASGMHEGQYSKSALGWFTRSGAMLNGVTRWMPLP